MSFALTHHGCSGLPICDSSFQVQIILATCCTGCKATLNLLIRVGGSVGHQQRDVERQMRASFLKNLAYTSLLKSG